MILTVEIPGHFSLEDMERKQDWIRDQLRTVCHNPDIRVYLGPPDSDGDFDEDDDYYEEKERQERAWQDYYATEGVSLVHPSLIPGRNL